MFSIKLKFSAVSQKYKIHVSIKKKKKVNVIHLIYTNRTDIFILLEFNYRL